MIIARKLAAFALLTCSFSAMAVPVITDDFESGLGGWTGKGGGAHDGIIVADPFNASNNVLTFTSLESAGEIFTVDRATRALANRFLHFSTHSIQLTPILCFMAF